MRTLKEAILSFEPKELVITTKYNTLGYDRKDFYKISDNFLSFSVKRYIYNNEKLVVVI